MTLPQLYINTANQPNPTPAKKAIMAMMKKYLLNLLALCSDEKFGQDAVEWAIMTGRVHLSYKLQEDLRLIMGEPGRPETGKYEVLCDAWRRTCRDHEAALLESYQPLLEELNRSVPLHQAA
jgi:hypothetical protein